MRYLPGLYSSSLVQLGQRMALTAISVQQKGQTLVVGAAGLASGFFLSSLLLLIALMMRKRTK